MQAILHSEITYRSSNTELGRPLWSELPLRESGNPKFIFQKLVFLAENTNNKSRMWHFGKISFLASCIRLKFSFPREGLCFHCCMCIDECFYPQLKKNGLIKPPGYFWPSLWSTGGHEHKR